MENDEFSRLSNSSTVSLRTESCRASRGLPPVAAGVHPRHLVRNGVSGAPFCSRHWSGRRGSRAARPSRTLLPCSAVGPRPAAAQHPAGAEQRGRAGRPAVVTGVLPALLLDVPGPARPSRHGMHLGRALLLLLQPAVAGGGRGDAARLRPALCGRVRSRQDISGRKASAEGEAGSPRRNIFAHQLLVGAG